MSENKKNNDSSSIWHPIQGPLGAGLTLGALVFMGSLLGILTRMENHLASFWLANAIMAGVLLRIPASSTLFGWLVATLGFLSADLITGSYPLKAGLLTLANLVGVAAIRAAYLRLTRGLIGIRQPLAVLHLACACACGAAASGVVGGLINPVLFDDGVLIGYLFWFVTEFANYIGILPVLLTAPALPDLCRRVVRYMTTPAYRANLLPVLLLMVSCVGAQLIGGPGAIAFPVPALLWCAVSYSTFATATLTLLTSAWMLVSYSNSLPFNAEAMISLRLGVFLIVPGPIMLSLLMQSNNSLLATLKHMAARNGLTGVSNRLDFMERARQQLRSGGSPVGVMMIDLDHFKAINDTHGHAAGDAVLVSVASRIQHCLRTGDLLGRLGGEEFAILIDGHSAEELAAIAERIRLTVVQAAVRIPEGVALPVTMSIGVAVAESDGRLSIEQLLAASDAALYRAKNEGRNRVVVTSLLPDWSADAEFGQGVVR